MAQGIKWIEDKAENYRGNWKQFAFRFDNSPYLFHWGAYMTYKGFKSAVRKMAQHYNAKTVTVCEEFQGTQQEFFDDPHAMIVLHLGDDKYIFRKEYCVEEGELRRFKEYSEAEIFNAESGK